jgi:WXG100 family type VII secretion target
VGGYAVDAAELQRCDALLGALADHARAALAQLEANAAAVVDGWQGCAGSAFRLAWGHWLDGAGAMLDVLDETALALGISGVGYAMTDDAVRTSLRGGVQ